MAWDLQRDMHGEVRRAVLHAAEQPDGLTWTVRVLTTQRSEGTTDLDEIRAIEDKIRWEIKALGTHAYHAEEIAEHAIEVGSTTNGGWAVYLDSGGWEQLLFLDDNDDEDGDGEADDD